MTSKSMKTRVITLVMAIMVCLLFSQTSQDVYATEITSNGETRTEVDARKDSVFTVILPKSISAINTNTLNYSVTVKGDVASDESIIVTPIDASDSDDGVNVILKDASESIIKKNDVVATVVQDKDLWSSSEVMQKDDGGNLIGTTIAGNITSDVTAGNWDGILKFDITVESEPILQPGLYTLDDALVTPWDELVANGTCTVRDGTLTTSSNRSSLITQKLVISNDVSAIGATAFAGCQQLKQVVIPNSVTSIGQNGFRASGITSISVPSTVTNIGASVFEQCTSLVSAELKTNVPEAAFRNCTSLETVALNDTVNIGNYAFYGASRLKTVNLPNTLTSLGDYAFRDTAIEEVTIPTSVTKISQYCFAHCKSLKDVIIPSSITNIGSSAFYDCTAANTIIIPESATTIASDAFGNVPSIEYHGLSVPSAAYGAKFVSLYVPDGTTEIRSGMYQACGKITDVHLPNSIVTIGDYAFQGDTGITSINIPSSITSIGMNAFTNCTSLSNLDIPDSVTSIGDNAFINVPSVTYHGSATGSPWGALSINQYCVSKSE